MAGGYYRVHPENLTFIEHQWQTPTEIYINRDFIRNKPDPCIELDQLQGGSCSTGMYNNSSQYPNTGYQSSYPQYQQTYSTAYGYQSYGYQNAHAPTQPAPPGESYPHNNWSTSGYVPPHKEDKSQAVAQEMQQQKAQLVKQREDYVRKASVLRHELEQLRNQKQDLLSDGSSDRDLAKIVKENDKLQDEIQGKMKAIYNVIEMLSSIIKDGKKVADLEADLVAEAEPQQQSPLPPAIVAAGRESTVKSPVRESPSQDRDRRVEGEKEKEKRYNYVYYDSGMHWCRSCDAFPETAKNLLLHLQSKEHQDTAKENEVDTTPWHKLPMEAMNPSYEDAPKKRIPIKGLQFFISAPSWYCKLCDVWIGDLHCASHHLKSQAHFQNYENFIEQNPHWEMEWMKDREKAKTRSGKNGSSDSDETSNKKKNKRKANSFLGKEKKKKKRSKKKRKQSSDSSSSSSSSDSSSDDNTDRSRSIRVAMRNMSKVQSIMNEDMSKWNVLERLLEDHRRKEKDKEKAAAVEKLVGKEPEDELINQWMTISEPPDKERVLLDSLKDRMRAKQELEKAKYAELERRRKDKEREEQETLERKQREMREQQEALDREIKRREQEEYQRIVDKDRNQVKFKASRDLVTRDNYRRRRSASKSDGEEDGRYENNHRGESAHRRRRESERSHNSRKSEARSESRDREQHKPEEKKKPPGPPSYKKLPFIGRMPLFKNKKFEEKPVEKELKKEDYEPQRRTRFEPGNLSKAFMPQPDVVCFPKLSSIPPITVPPPAPQVLEPPPVAPAPPKISPPKEAPPPPKIRAIEKPMKPVHDLEVNEDNLYSEHGPEMDPDIMGQYYQGYNNMMYSQMYEYSAQQHAGGNHMQPDVPLSHTMPLEPPPLPPDDDLALLGICADDMAAQSF